ncbi:M15 family metallopeptidase [Isoptericola sp. BMS4]|uniref:M15 family metallopeptidase n=1 Tax=Isoptericola sp. BMS4 TaxID=2527875 RepID=UPI00141E7B8E|nr:M15 family metallopeptidase [Isoptericola sp. BMS4]
MTSARGADQGRRPASLSSARRVLRLVGTGTASCVLAAGLLALPVLGMPGGSALDAAQDLPEIGAGSPVGAGVSVGVVRAETAERPATVDEVLEVLERAERAAHEEGRARTPEIDQAAAELGMLLSTYLAQEAATRAGVDGDRPASVAEGEPAPEERESGTDAGAEPAERTSRNAGGDTTDDTTTDPAGTGETGTTASGTTALGDGGPDDAASDGAETEDTAPGDTKSGGAKSGGAKSGGAAAGATTEAPRTADDTSEGAKADDTTSDGAKTGGPKADDPKVDDPKADAAGEAGTEEQGGAAGERVPGEAGDAGESVAAAGTPATEDDGSTAAGDGGPDVAEGRPEAVSFDDVVVAAARLANLLDPASATLVTSIVPAHVAGDLAFSASGGTLTAGLRAVVEKYAGSTAGYANGRIPTSVLCPLDFAPGHMLRCDAAEQLMALNEEYEEEFGTAIPMTDSYRPYDVQVRLKQTKPYLAAVPGTSNHGWGLAVDLSTPISTGRSAEYAWLRVHGPDFGWDNPSWARLDGSKPEPWHFEFFAAGPIPDRAWHPSDVVGAGGASDGGKGGSQAADRPRAGQGPGSGHRDEGRSGGEGTGSAGGDRASGGGTGGGGGSHTAPPAKPSDGPSPKPTPSEPKPSPSDPTPKPSPSDPTPKPTQPPTLDSLTTRVATTA